MTNILSKKAINLRNNIKFHEINNASSIFQDIYKKNLKKNNQNYSNKNKTEELLKIIENMRLREEMIETDKDYILKESKKEIRINQELTNLYGKRKWSYKKTKIKEKIKLNKKLFLNLSEEKEDNLPYIKNKENILKLPMIINKNNIKELLPKNNQKEKILFNSEENNQKLNLNDSFSSSNFDESKIINENISTYYSYNNKNNKKKELK